MSDSQQNWKGEKNVYPTLAAALKAKHSVANRFGNRFRKLRIYKTRSGWCLTKRTKGTFV
jgi:hypothetical protein